MQRADHRSRWPDDILVIGAGRWARTIAGVLCEIAPPTVHIRMHTRGHASSLCSWIDQRQAHRYIGLSQGWPPPANASVRTAVIVANAARNHAEAAEWALHQRMPVLVEKPLVDSLCVAEHIAVLSQELAVKLAPAHVFLFARYVERFARMLAQRGEISTFEVDWSDPSSEERHGEVKRYDAALPVHADWLPHIVPLIGAMIGRTPTRCETVRFARGGAAVQIELTAGNVECRIAVERNAGARRRIFRALVDGEAIELDFSTEPGSIRIGDAHAVADPEWAHGERPLASMLSTFLYWAAGGEADDRLALQPALDTCRLVDGVDKIYQAEQLCWLQRQLQRDKPEDEDGVRYALSERLAASGAALSGAALADASAWLADRFRQEGGSELSRRLSAASSPSRFLLDVLETRPNRETCSH